MSRAWSARRHSRRSSFSSARGIRTCPTSRRCASPRAAAAQARTRPSRCSARRTRCRRTRATASAKTSPPSYRIARSVWASCKSPSRSAGTAQPSCGPQRSSESTSSRRRRSSPSSRASRQGSSSSRRHPTAPSTASGARRRRFAWRTAAASNSPRRFRGPIGQTPQSAKTCASSSPSRRCRGASTSSRGSCATSRSRHETPTPSTFPCPTGPRASASPTTSPRRSSPPLPKDASFCCGRLWTGAPRRSSSRCCSWRRVRRL
mmetsp:Transcript_26792/g.90217  ORF Transcript_26792/g.90217 Transcript_26792/m.90217 type:complete len:262 (-) Transcript_26792:744-1529(-)